LLVDHAKIVVIVNFPPPKSVRRLRTTLGHTRYYGKCIKGYAHITTPMEKLLKKEAKFQWNEYCHKGLDVLKQKLVTVPIMVFLYWQKEFHVHVDASSIALDEVLSQPTEGELYHSISFASKKLSTIEKNYTMTEREGLTMVYVLQKFIHYLLGSHFKMYTYHSTLGYQVNKSVLGGRICRWLLLFQEYDFEVIVKPRKLTIGPDHLLWILTGEDAGNLDDSLPNAHLFSVQMVNDHFAEIVQYLSIEVVPSYMTIAQKKHPVVKAVDY
jgi:hypothetical protein